MRRCFVGIEFGAYSSMLFIVYLCYILAVRRFDGWIPIWVWSVRQTLPTRWGN